MRILFLDCQAGAAGDMWVGALLGVGLEWQLLADAVASLGLQGVRIRRETVDRAGLAATRFAVEVDPARRRTHRHLPEVLEVVARAAIPDRARERAAAVFQRLAAAEATAHGVAVEAIHFHEVGADDALVDVVGACMGLEALGVQRVYASAVEVGSGTVRCEHGVLPVPAPGALHCLEGLPLTRGGAPGERTTPTGAALLRELVDEFEPRLRYVPRSVGLGAGARDDPGFPNVLRATLGDAADAPRGRATDIVVELSCNLDTATGEQLGWLVDEALRQGALDAWVVPATMKKGRPGHVLSVLVDPADRAALTGLLLAESSSLGVRAQVLERAVLERWEEVRETGWGPVRFKCARLPDGREIARPEHDEVVRLARERGLGRGAVLARLSADA